MSYHHALFYFLISTVCTAFVNAYDVKENSLDSKLVYHEKYMRQAIELAQSSRDHGDQPFGALLVHNDNVILTAENSVIKSNDFTAHAEMVLVQAARRKFPIEILRHATLYTSTEPCAMCAGAIVWSGIGHVVYGSPAEILSELSNGIFIVPCRSLFEKSKRKISCEGPILEEECRNVHKGFWNPVRLKR